jgi:hypothetical protein
MTERESLGRALEDHDVTLAFTLPQLILAVLGFWLVLRVLRGLRR